MQLNKIQLIAFMVGGKEYALRVTDVHEIIRVSHITRVPHSYPCMAGVINLRGMVIPVMDLAQRLGLPPLVCAEDTRIIITRWQGESVGFLADCVSEVIKVPTAGIEPSSVLASEEAAGLFSGISKLGQRMFFILDLEKLFQLDDADGVFKRGPGNVQV